MSRLEAAANSSTQCQCYDDEGQAYCLVINNEDYSSSGLTIRHGSSRDASGIRDELEERNVTVDTINNCTAQQIYSSLKGLRNITGAMYRFLMIIILSHGFHGRIIGTDGIRIDVNDIVEILSAVNLPAFKNKPKILILHTCQEEEDDEGGNDNHISLTEKHFLLALPTLPHCLAYRQPSRGTFYIQCFLKVLREKGDTEGLLSMLMNVTGNLQKEIDAVKPGLTQTPVILTNLAGDVYLKRSCHKRLRDINCPLQSDSYYFIPSMTGPLEMHIQAMHNYNSYQQNNTGASQTRSALESVVEEPVISENISYNGSLERASSSNTRSENLEANTEEPTEIQEHINASGQPLPVYVASAASKSVEKYQSGISKATEPLAANGVVEPKKISQISQIDHEVLSPPLLWDDIETPNETEEERKEEEKEEEQLHNSTTVLHKLLVQENENEITIQTETMEETQPKSRTLSDETEVPELILKKSNQHQSDETEYNENKSKGIFGDLMRLTVTSAGLTHHCSQYGVTLIIPEGAVQQPANVWFGACLYSDKFNFGDYVPVTPIVRVHVDTELMKPVELYLPHHVDDTDPVTRSKLTLLTADDDPHSGLSFTVISKECVMNVQSGLCKISDNFCSRCVAVKMTDQSIKKKYMIAMAEKQEYMIFRVEFCIFFPQIACIKFVQDHYSKREFTLTAYDDIKFDESGCISIKFEPDELAGWKRTPEGFNNVKILEKNVDYFEVMNCKVRTVDEKNILFLKERENMLLYPPRFRYKFQCTKWPPDTQVKAVIGPEQKTVYLFTDLLPLLALPTEVSSDNSCRNIPSKYDDVLLKLLLVLDNGFIEGKNLFLFGIILGLDIDQLRAIEKNYKEKVHVREILIAWREKNPNEQSLKPVADALKIIGLDSLARQLEGQLEERPGEVKIHPDAQQHLGSLRSILLALNDVQFGASTWDMLGLHLGLRQTTLNEIKRENAGNCKQCLKETIGAWLKCQDDVQEATAQGLIKAVESTGDRAAANKLHKKYNIN